MLQLTTSQVTSALKLFFRKTADQDSNGIITYAEFLEFVMNNLKLSAEEVNIWEKFQEISGDSDVINETRFVTFFQTVNYKFKEVVDFEGINTIGRMFGCFRKLKCPFEAAVLMEIYNIYTFYIVTLKLLAADSLKLNVYNM
eukprot:GFUD01031002.1.p1 GENE.GFUD01031002.1~~GFUD01031002.1.p1  ORF type:complete len:142 (-),score=27.41 GFUD01031002.1:20-445(-)